jgi:glycosyltransferase involved in cell wall biosynthesis
MKDKYFNIFWVSWHRNPYNDFLFNEISRVYKLDVYYIKEILESHPWDKKENAKYRYFELSNIKQIFSSFRKCTLPYNLRVIAGWNHPIMILMIIYLSFTRKKFVIWSDTPNTTKNRSLLKLKLRNLWLKFIFNQATKIMVTGNIGISKMIQIGAQKEKLINFPFATDLNLFIPKSDNSLSKQNIIFLSSGRLLNSHKGFDIAIKALSLLKKFHPNYNFLYLIAGTGKDESALTNLIKKENLENFVKLQGWIQKNNLLAFYRTGDIFVHPSHFDPFPNVVLEAMAVGLPVVGSSSAGSVLDRVQEGVNGFIFEDGDVYQLYEKMVQIFININSLNKMKIAARMTAESWSVDRNINQLTKMIYEIKN